MTPKHIGIIMDGNRRWARQKGLKATQGHQEGYKILRDLSRYVLLEKKIPFVSAYAFSTENWSRAEEEVGFIMGLVTRALSEYLDEFHRDGIKIVILGSQEKLDAKVASALKKAEEKTKDNTAGTLALCFNYGGQQEIIDATKKLIEQKVNPDDIDIEAFSQALYQPEVPPVDLIIRTSGEQRLSGYMLWRAAYSELVFIDKYWPEFTKADIDAALAEYARRQRRFGA